MAKNQFLALCLAVTFTPALAATSAQPVETLGFQELRLGMSQKTVSRTRKLVCYLAQPGEKLCTVQNPRPVDKIRSEQIELVFSDDVLGKIGISIGDRGATTPNFDGTGTWLAYKLITLTESLDNRFGKHEQRQMPECPRSRGCRGAPMKNLLKWRAAGGTITLTYWEATYLGFPKLEFLSNHYARAHL